MFVPPHFSTCERNTVDEHAVVADEPGGLAGRARDPLEQRRGRALSCRARDSEAAHRPRRVAVQPRRRRPEGPRDARDPSLRDRRAAGCAPRGARPRRRRRPAAAWSCPSKRAPDRHAKQVPGRTRRLSSVMKVTSTSASFTRSTTSRPASSSCHRTRARPLGSPTIRRPSGYRSPSDAPGSGSGGRRPPRRPADSWGRAHGAGGTRSAPSACCMIWENAGAATVPPKMALLGSSSTTIAARRGEFAGANPTNDATYR